MNFIIYYRSIQKLYEENSIGSGNHDSPWRRHSDDILTSHWRKHYTVNAAPVVEIAIALHAALSPAMVW